LTNDDKNRTSYLSAGMKRILLATLLLAAGSALAAGPASGGFRTAIIANDHLDVANDELQFARIKAAGANAVRIEAPWSGVAPAVRPKGFDPTNPDDPAYRWSDVDKRVKLAVQNDLIPILGISGAPKWAEANVPPGVPHGPRDGPYKPNPRMLGQFARAAALRYRGGFQGLPRVRYWRAWNEPNIYRYLTPQKENGKPFSPEWYRKMLNEFSQSVHGVRGDNLVIAGSLAPFGIDRRISPLTFMRLMLCMSNGKKPHAMCNRQSSFDIWSHHPYTRGDPFHHAQSPDDVSLGDLPKMRALLEAARRTHRIVTRHKNIQFWVTEFSYDSHPPDPSELTVPIFLHARWVAESFYQMWRSGVSLGTWYLLRDEPVKKSPFQSGLYFNGCNCWNGLETDRPKPALTAFRFPFVAYRHKMKVSLWGRTPDSAPGRVTIDVGTKTGWRRVGAVRATATGIFTGKLPYSAIKKKMGQRRAAAQYKQAVLADRPRSYWRLDDPGRVARDQTRHAPGTYRGSPGRGVQGALKGQPDLAVQFGQGAKVQLPTMSTPQTVELWLKTKNGGQLPALSFRDSAPDGLWVGPSGGFAYASEGDASLTGFSFVNDKKWHYFVYTVGKNLVARLYVDGRLNDQAPWNPFSDSVPANLGYDNVLDGYFKGALDEVAIYDHPLTQKQIARHYAASGRTAVTYGSLRARIGTGASWPFSLKRPRDRFVLSFG